MKSPVDSGDGRAHAVALALRAVLVEHDHAGPLLDLLHELARAVGRVALDDDDLAVDARDLRGVHALEGLGEGPRLVEDGHDDRELGAGGRAPRPGRASRAGRSASRCAGPSTRPGAPRRRAAGARGRGARRAPCVSRERDRMPHDCGRKPAARVARVSGTADRANRGRRSPRMAASSPTTTTRSPPGLSAARTRLSKATGSACSTAPLMKAASKPASGQRGMRGLARHRP